MAWELIIDGTLDGAANMAVDAALLGEVERFPGARTVVRFYGWRRPTVSLGRNQKVENAVDVDYCRANGIDIVQRPDGIMLAYSFARRELREDQDPGGSAAISQERG